MASAATRTTLTAPTVDVRVLLRVGMPVRAEHLVMPVVATLLRHVLVVVRAIPEEQVLRVYAGRIVAAMQHSDVVRKLPKVNQPGCPVREDAVPRGIFQFSVGPFSRPGSRELPTALGCAIDLAPKPLLERASDPYADRMICIAEAEESLVVGAA